MRRVLTVAGSASGVVVALVFPLIDRAPYHQTLAVTVLLYALMAVAWNIVGGYAGQVSLGNAIFFGIGAYVSSILLRDYLISPWIGMLVGTIVSVAVACAIGIPAFRLKGHYFAIATLAMGQIFFILVLNSGALGKASGISLPILPAALVNMEFNDKASYYYLVLGFLAAALASVFALERSRLGFYLRAIREDPTAASALGVNVPRFKLIAFALTAAFSSMAGTLYAQYLLFVDPFTVFALSVSVTMLLMAVLGGLGTLWGPVLGAVTLVALGEATRVTLGGSGTAVDLMVYGLLVMAIAVYKPHGLISIFRSHPSRVRRS